MKTIILLLLVLIISESSFGQQNNSASGLTKQDYLQKSKRQRTTAGVLLGGGFVSFGVGFLTLGGKQTNSVDNVIMLLAGMGAMVTSVPFFIAGSINKKKAIRMSFTNQMVPGFQNGSSVNRAIPSLNLKINI